MSTLPRSAGAIVIGGGVMGASTAYHLAKRGCLGAYTTFSSYAVESLILLRDGSIWTALLNIFGNNLAGLAAAFLGFILARWIG